MARARPRWALDPLGRLGPCSPAVALLAVAAVVAGERTCRRTTTPARGRPGDVDEVTISGGLVDGARGAATVEVHWSSVVRSTRCPRSSRPGPGRAGRTRATTSRSSRSVEDDLTVDRSRTLVVHHDEPGTATPRCSGGGCRRGPASSLSSSWLEHLDADRRWPPAVAGQQVGRGSGSSCWRQPVGTARLPAAGWADRARSRRGSDEHRIRGGWGFVLALRGRCGRSACSVR